MNKAELANLAETLGCLQTLAMDMILNSGSTLSTGDILEALAPLSNLQDEIQAMIQEGDKA